MFVSKPCRAGSLLLVPLLAACTGKEDPPVDDTEVVEDPVGIESVTVPAAAGWDPTWVTLDDGTQDAPVITTQDGTPVPLAPLVAGEVRYAWAGDPPLAPGVYPVLGTETIPVTEPLAFEIGTWGADPSFDAQGLVGTTWVLDRDSPTVPVPAGLGEVLYAQLGTTLITIDAVDGDQVSFGVYTTVLGTTDRCQALRATGTVSETGEFWWSTDAIEADIEPTPVHVEAVSLHWGWLGDGTAAAGVEGSALIDTRPLDPVVAEGGQLGATCELLAGFGVACRACAWDGAPYCSDVRLHAGQLSLTDEVIPDDVLLCGVDLEEGTEGLSCDVDLSGLSCAGLLLPMGVVGWIGRRRRRIAPPLG